MAEPVHRVVIIGGGFGGLHAAFSLAKAPVRITLVDRRNFHLFQPLLYQVATGGLSPANIASPLRAVLKKQRNTAVMLGEVTAIDVKERRVQLSDGELAYDTLIVAAGARHHYFGHPEWEELAPGLKTIEDATGIRARVLTAFEEAERAADPAQRRAWLTFVVVGGGPTGVELAGALAELARYTLRSNFRVIDPATAAIILVEGENRILPPYPPSLSAKAAESLRRMGVTVRLATHVVDIAPDSVTLRTANGEETIAARTVLWAAGVQASPLARQLAEAAGAESDRCGRLFIEPDCTLAGHPEIFVIGDMAHCKLPDGKPAPGVAPVAMQQGQYVARLIQARLNGKTITRPFRYKDLGNMATIGRASAVVDLGWLRISGWLAWMTWLFVHLINLVQFESRVFVLLQWAWSYITRNRSARLITDSRPPDPP